MFGLGSLAIPTSLLESAVQAALVDVLVPAAAPPLGMTARILLALALAGVGLVAGAAIARRTACPKPDQAERQRGAEWPGEAGAQAPLPDDGLPFPVAQDHARIEIAESVVQPEDAPAKHFPRLYVTEQPEAALPVSDGWVAQPETGEWPMATGEEEPAPSPVSPSPVSPSSVSPVPAVPANASVAHASLSNPSPAASDPDVLSHAELLDRLELALRRRRERFSAMAPGAAAAPAAPAHTDVTVPFPPLVAQEAVPAETGLAPSDLTETGWLEDHDIAFSPLPDFAVPQPGESLDFATPEFDGEEDEFARRDFVTPRQIITPSFAALADCSDNEDEDEYDEEEDEDDDSGKGYSSLIDYSRPSPLMKQACLRLEDTPSEAGADDPLAPFPGEQGLPDSFGMAPADGVPPPPSSTPPVSEETEQALRAALANLQRMGGAA